MVSLRTDFAIWTLFVQFTAKSPDNPRQIGYDYGFLEIVEGPLYAYISQGSYAVYIEKKV